MNKVNLIVNYYVPFRERNGKFIEDINRGVFNFHPDNITSFNNAINGTVIRFVDVGEVKVAMSFDAVLALFREYAHIDNRFEDEVDLYKADNLFFIKRDIREQDGETE